MSTLAPTRSPGIQSPLVHPLLANVRATKLRADQLRSELAAAEREHHEAVLGCHSAEDEHGFEVFTVAEIAAAALCSRGRIYKRLGKPSYGDRSTAKSAYQ